LAAKPTLGYKSSQAGLVIRKCALGRRSRPGRSVAAGARVLALFN
jgi:hypothetical protein